MTKEQILEKMIEEMPFTLPTACIPYIKEAMDIYAQQEVAKEREKHEALILETIESMDDIMKEELAKEREKAKKLVEALEEIYQSTKDGKIYEIARKALYQTSNIQQETTGNQTAC